MLPKVTQEKILDDVLLDQLLPDFLANSRDSRRSKPLSSSVGDILKASIDIIRPSVVAYRGVTAFETLFLYDVLQAHLDAL